jgi:hypothetical protein
VVLHFGFILAGLHRAGRLFTGVRHVQHRVRVTSALGSWDRVQGTGFKAPGSVDRVQGPGFKVPFKHGFKPHRFRLGRSAFDGARRSSLDLGNEKRHGPLAGLRGVGCLVIPLREKRKNATGLARARGACGLKEFRTYMTQSGRTLAVSACVTV